MIPLSEQKLISRTTWSIFISCTWWFCTSRNVQSASLDGVRVQRVFDFTDDRSRFILQVTRLAEMVEFVFLICHY